MTPPAARNAQAGGINILESDRESVNFPRQRLRSCLVRPQLLSGRVRALSVFSFCPAVFVPCPPFAVVRPCHPLSAFKVGADTPSSAPLGDGAAIQDRAPVSGAAPPCACQRCGSRSPHRIPTPRAAARAATPPDRCAESAP